MSFTGSGCSSQSGSIPGRLRLPFFSRHPQVGDGGAGRNLLRVGAQFDHITLSASGYALGMVAAIAGGAVYLQWRTKTDIARLGCAT